MNSSLLSAPSYTHLILGGARSGKSSYAESLATEYSTQNSLPLTYIATATAGDDEMHRRIEKHQRDRHDNWNLVEEPIELATALLASPPPSVILIDCLTLWLSNCLHHSEGCWEDQKRAFVCALNDNAARTESSHKVLMVSNEVGCGIIPMGELSRRYVDEVGWLHQELAHQSTNVTMITAGLPQKLK